MPIDQWSDNILILELSDEPTFSEEMDALLRRLDAGKFNGADVIVNLKDVTYLNSSNIGALLKLRNLLKRGNQRLRICTVQNSVWSVLLTAGLDQVFEFTEDVSTSLASLQLEA